MPFPPPPPRSPMPAMDQIPGEKVYIGGMFALREKTDMKAKAITHVLSVLRLPLDKSLFRNFEHLAIEVNDMEEENLLQHFATANAFIEKAIASGGAVLIHCAMGKSRSATVLVAYLMRSRRIGVEEAVQLVREIRPFVEPNPGFIKQLELYYEMDYTTDLEHPLYKQWLHQQELAQSMAAKRSPRRVHFRDSEKVAPEAAQAKEGETPEQAGLTELRCKRYTSSQTRSS